ncbi:MAG TPA: VWA domain-containing protein [Gemmatimonadaceae bacterium]|nr:VWA domain-containing protein [Gemmatimonadaceae bacterium]
MIETPFFDDPWMLAATPVLVLAVVLLIIGAYRRRRTRLRRLASTALIERLLPPAIERSPWRRATLLGLAAAFAGVAFAGPRWGTERTVERGSGVDIVLAMDASLSMLATDAHPSRLENMKEEARRLLALSGGDRFGLVAFAGRSYILTPLTVDQGALDLYLDNLDPTVVGEAGTSMSRAIAQGTDLLLATPTTSDRALIVMSDGESFESTDDVVAAAKAAADSGIAVITVGFGTVNGTTIPIAGPQGITQKKDQSGHVVITHYTPDMLRAAAQAAHGTFIEASATDKAARIRRALATLRREGRATPTGRERRPRFQLFLIPAILLVLADTLLAERRPQRAPVALGTASRAAAAMLLIVALGIPRAAHAEGPGGLRGAGADGDELYRAGRYKEAAAAYEEALRSGKDPARLEYNLGTALLAAGDRDDAMAALEHAAQIADDADLRYRALFNLGLGYLQRARTAAGQDKSQAYQSALDAYRKALRLKPNELDAKWNYELANKNRKSGGGGARDNARPDQGSAAKPSNHPNAGIDKQQAEQLLNSAEREERDVQARKQRENQPSPPPGGKDW